jgi:hypothetical protein
MLSFWRGQLVDADAIKWRWAQCVGNGAKTPSVSSLQVCAKDGSVSVSQSQSHNVDAVAVPVRAVGCAVRAQHKVFVSVFGKSQKTCFAQTDRRDLQLTDS